MKFVAFSTLFQVAIPFCFLKERESNSPSSSLLSESDKLLSRSILRHCGDFRAGFPGITSSHHCIVHTLLQTKQPKYNSGETCQRCKSQNLSWCSVLFPAYLNRTGRVWDKKWQEAGFYTLHRKIGKKKEKRSQKPRYPLDLAEEFCGCLHHPSLSPAAITSNHGI